MPKRDIYINIGPVENKYKEVSKQNKKYCKPFLYNILCRNNWR